MSEPESNADTRAPQRKNPPDAPESAERHRPRPLLPQPPETTRTLPDVEAFGRSNPAPGTEAFGRSTKPVEYEAFALGRKTPPPDKRNAEKEEDKDEEQDPKPENNTQNEKKQDKPQKPPIYKRPLFWIILAIVLAILIVAGILFWLHIRHFEKTDDAYIDGNVTQIAPQVSAPVLHLYINDNTLVKPGQLLVELDPTDFQVALDQAKAAEAAARGHLAQAKAQVDAAQAVVKQREAEINAAQTELDNATKNLQRYQNVDPRARSQQQLDNAVTAQKNAQASLDQAKARKTSADADVLTAQANVKAADGDLQRALADEHRAQVNLGYCKITAPIEGRVTSRSVNVGAYVQTGQSMFSLVSPDVWVTANFKETQLTHMKPGQPVDISVDAYPDKTWHGHVQSIQAGSGSRFSVLPAENATGNFVKIVQRVPVKITFDHDPNHNDPDFRLLSPGLSVEPKVTVR